MPISNLNHCAARQVGTAHILVVRLQFKKAKAAHVHGDEYVRVCLLYRLLFHTDLNMKEFDLHIHGLETFSQLVRYKEDCQLILL